MDNEVIDSFLFNMDIKPLQKGIYKVGKEYDLDSSSFYFVRVTAYIKDKTLYSDKMHEIYFRDNPINSSFNKNVTSFNEPTLGELEVYTTSQHIVVQHNDFKSIFDGLNYQDGGLQAIVKNDKIYFKNNVQPTLYRATTDNDNVGSKYFHSFYMGGSKHPIYIPFFGGLKIIEQTKDKVVVEYTYRMFIGAFLKNIKVHYTVYSNETIKVSYTFKKPKLVKAPPLVGLKFIFSKEATKYKYLGLGPYDSYIDRYKGLKYGHYEDNSIDSLVKYSRPQECGSRMYTKEVEIEINENQKIKFIALNNTFSFKYLPYDEFEIENAEHISDLPISKRNVLTIEAFNKGVGGDDSLGSPVHKKYLLKEKIIKPEFLIMITK